MARRQPDTGGYAVAGFTAPGIIYTIDNRGFSALREDSLLLVAHFALSST